MNLQRRTPRARLLLGAAIMTGLLGLGARPNFAAGVDSLTAARRATDPSFVELMARADSAVRARGGSKAPHARLYLSWNAPWGQKRASATLNPKLVDTVRDDTLYLCFLPGRTGDSFAGFTANLLIRPQPGDTLGPFWDFAKTGANAGGLAVQFGPDSSFPMAQPWRVKGMGQPILEKTPSGSRLRMVYAVGYKQGAPVDSGSVLCLARVLIRHRNAALAGARQPVCIEWESATLAYALKDEPEVNVGERFACWAGTGNTACAPFRTPMRAPAWKPGQARTSGGR